MRLKHGRFYTTGVKLEGILNAEPARTPEGLLIGVYQRDHKAKIPGVKPEDPELPATEESEVFVPEHIQILADNGENLLRVNPANRNEFIDVRFEPRQLGDLAELVEADHIPRAHSKKPGEKLV